MAHFGAGVEQALHYLFRLGADESDLRPSARDVADFYHLPPSVAAKLFTRLEKAGIVHADEGRDGGFSLARPLGRITVLEVTDAVEGRKPLFQCKDIRQTCAAFEGGTPDWASSGVCAIHAAMIEAEQAMRRSLAGVTLQDIANRARKTIPATFRDKSAEWFRARRRQRRLPRQRAAEERERG